MLLLAPGWLQDAAAEWLHAFTGRAWDVCTHVVLGVAESGLLAQLLQLVHSVLQRGSLQLGKVGDAVAVAAHLQALVGCGLLFKLCGAHSSAIRAVLATHPA